MTVKIYDSRLFYYDPTTETFYQEASQLDGFSTEVFCENLINERVGIKSHKTGKIMYFDYKERKLDDDNDVLGWEFTSVIQYAHHVKYKDLKVVIFNN